MKNSKTPTLIQNGIMHNLKAQQKDYMKTQIASNYVKDGDITIDFL